MAKKKKKKSKADARGYSTHTTKGVTEKVAGSAVQKVAVTSKAHEGLTNLLGDLASSPDVTELKDESFASAHDKKDDSVSVEDSSTRKTNIPVSWRKDDNLSRDLDHESPRFLKKVTNLHGKLLDLKFSEEKIEEVMREMTLRGLDLNTETSLDWLCLNMPTEQLPPLFGEATIRISALGGEGEISVVKHERSSIAASGEENERAAAELSLTLTNLALKKRGVSSEESPEGSSELNDESEKDSKETRARLLEQYQYMEESDDEMNEEVPKAEEEGGIGIDVECLVTPQERQLAELEKQIEEDRASLNDDAANYMRSKHEIAELKKRLKKAEGQARGLRGKVAKIRSAREKETVQSTEVPQGTTDKNGKSDDSKEGGYALSLFDNESTLKDAVEERVSDEKKAKSAPPEAMAAMECTTSRLLGIDSSGPSIPKGWTGKTPKKFLEEWCQKRKLPKPQFQKMRGSRHACRVVVHREPKQPQTKRSKKKAQDSPAELLSIEEKGPFNSFADAQHFLSTEALYELNPNLPLYRIFPPVFRDLWKGWVDAIVAEKEAEVKVRQQSKDDKMKHLARSLPAKAPLLISLNDGPVGVAKSAQLNSSTTEPDVPESWDDDSVTEENEPSSTLMTIEPTSLGERLREEFSRQRSFKRYIQMADERRSLPMSSYRQELLDTVKSNQVTVLCAQTGAGKTTQCPQFLLEDALLSGHGDKVNIICTQPRRISAISVAERVADEICEKIGEKIGYHIRGETRRSKNTKLMFCTTGVVLRRLQDDPILAGVTHVIIDEVHERQWQIDFLLIVIRQLIRTTRKDLKVILMSATLDSQLFCSFFHGAPFLSVPGRTFPVSEYYLEDLLDATDHIIEEGSRCAMRNENGRGSYASLWVTGRGGEKRRQVLSMEAEKGFAEVSDDYAGYTMATRRSMDRVDEEKINYDLIEDVLSLLLVDPRDGQVSLPTQQESAQIIKHAAVLVFLPGLGEIRTLSERLKGSYKFGSRQKFDIIPMHSTLPPKDQRRAFAKPRSGCRKIILATNICETSITIPDVAFVIDTGQVREVRTNKRTGTSTLETDWCSKASAKQRSGRAGRVQAGICCKLYSSKTATRVMKDQAMPELQRVPLEEVCLSILAAKMSPNCMDFLLQAPQPPEEESVQNALTLLTEVGAIQEFSPTSPAKIERLTPLGQHLAKLPVHVRLGKMLIFGALFRCLDKVLTIAASLSCSKSVFAASFDDAQQSAAHKSFFHVTSDFLTVCNVWDKYSAEMEESVSRGRRFCDKYYLSNTALMEIGDLRRQFLSLLEQLGFVCGCHVGSFSKNGIGLDLKEYNSNGNKESIVSAVICAGLYPNLAHAVKASCSGVPELWHGTERLHFHNSSVNHKKIALDSEWVVFYEKFATSRVYISATSLVRPFSILLFGRSLVVKHLDRKVVVDDWIELNIAAQTGVMFSNLRQEVDVLLKEMIQNPNDSHGKGNRMIRGIVNLLASEL
mmetsp:Transcript_5752/g.16586  ORF Transcript_5752/g.16586 Transcript_5752/m.16586 type:complete len:1474 (-) Transcript_5752:147-4568(-)|eukprot:CAMPEP_0113533634 /NCGR_PEP_ID=MMETSP0015_2-20120614/4719_1 /TAXON_ID=2838 /ORGANISM="Odontella" /LENGTH=1473 /DNA_ID=CAMNT_0000432719 /DNA_START=202 /DNA_END=4623 /DNA_ORIENTATION=+ /assembly_acc=CAM_ASM_000160